MKIYCQNVLQLSMNKKLVIAPNKIIYNQDEKKYCLLKNE